MLVPSFQRAVGIAETSYPVGPAPGGGTPLQHPVWEGHCCP